MTSVSLTLSITKDNIEEKNEKFRVLLKNPENAVLGKHTKVTLQIINADKTGESSLEPQALTLRIFRACLRKSPLYTKIVLMKKSYIHNTDIKFFMLVRGQSPLNILLVPVQFLLVPDNRTVLNVKP